MGRPFFGDSYEEFKLLLEEYNNYLLKRATRSTASFWATIIEKYFKLVPAKSEEEYEDKVEKIKAWFQNHANRGDVYENIVYIPKSAPEEKKIKKTKPKAAKKSLNKTVTQLLRGETKRYTRSNFNVYASEFEVEAAEVINRGWEEHKAKRVAEDNSLEGLTSKELDRILNGERVNVRNNSLKTHYATLPQSIQEKCEAKRLESTANVEEGECDSEGEHERQRKKDLKNRITAVRNLNDVVEGFLDTNCNETGFSFFLIAAGPDPRYGDEITSFCCEYLAEKNGESFIESIADFDKTIKIPFKKLVKKNARKADAKTNSTIGHVTEADEEKPDHNVVSTVPSSIQKGKNVLREMEDRIDLTRITREETDSTVESASFKKGQSRKTSIMGSVLNEDVTVTDGDAGGSHNVESVSDSEERRSTSSLDSDNDRRTALAASSSKTTSSNRMQGRGGDTREIVRNRSKDVPRISGKKENLKDSVQRHRGDLPNSGTPNSGTETHITEKLIADSALAGARQRDREKGKASAVPLTNVKNHHGIHPKNAASKNQSRTTIIPVIGSASSLGKELGGERQFLKASQHVNTDSSASTEPESSSTESDVESVYHTKASALRFKKRIRTDEDEVNVFGDDINETEETLARENHVVSRHVDENDRDCNMGGRKSVTTEETTVNLKSKEKKNRKGSLIQRQSDTEDVDKANNRSTGDAKNDRRQSSISEERSTKDCDVNKERPKGRFLSATRISETVNNRIGRNYSNSIPIDERSLSSLTSLDDSMSVSTANSDANSDADNDDIRSLYDKDMMRNFGYIRKGTVYLRRALGDRSLVFLDHWHKFERKKGFIKYDGQIGGYEDMPEKMKLFIKDQDYSAITLPESDIEFGKEWQYWWRIIQPHWRLLGSTKIADLKDEKYIPDYEEWQSLSVGGKKGILVAIVGLAIWAETWKARKGLRTTGKEIDNAVKDVNLVLEMMTMSLENKGKVQKRLSDSMEQSNAGPSKRRKIK